MRFIIKKSPNKRSSKLQKLFVGLSIGMGVVLTLSCFSDNETALFASGAMTALVSVFVA